MRRPKCYIFNCFIQFQKCFVPLRGIFHVNIARSFSQELLFTRNYHQFSEECAFNIFKQNTRGLYNRPIKGSIYFEKKTLANEIGTTTKNNLLRQKIFYRLFSLNIVIL